MPVSSSARTEDTNAGLLLKEESHGWEESCNQGSKEHRGNEWMANWCQKIVEKRGPFQRLMGKNYL